MSKLDWNPNPDCEYTHDYERIFHDIATGSLNRIRTYKNLILEDLYFIVQFVLAIPPHVDEIPFCNSKFVVEACKTIQNGPKDYTLDVWAREHFKSTIITIAETIQHALKYPDHSQAIFSYTSPVAKKFLFSIKEAFETKTILQECFPDIVWASPKSEAPIWSIDGGIILKRNTTRKEPTVSAWGLTEGMPTGLHFERRVYDDISTEDIATSYEMMEKVKLKFDSSQNLGTISGTHRVTGTYYDYNDPLMYIKDKVEMDEEDQSSKYPTYTYREKPATDNGARSGKPVFLTQKRLNALKNTKTFDCQQLLNPSPEDVRKLSSKFLQLIDRKDIPKKLVKFLVVDPAGDNKDGSGNSWAIGVVGFKPELDDLGLSECYIIDLLIAPLREEEAPDEIASMFTLNGFIDKVGIEKVSQSSTELHVKNALAKKGRVINEESGRLVILRPAGRNKKKRISNYLAWPLYNSKIYINKSIRNVYIDRLKSEMDRFPAWEDDGIDMLSYSYEMASDYHDVWIYNDPNQQVLDLINASNPRNYDPLHRDNVVNFDPLRRAAS